MRASCRILKGVGFCSVPVDYEGVKVLDVVGNSGNDLLIWCNNSTIVSVFTEENISIVGLIKKIR